MTWTGEIEAELKISLWYELDEEWDAKDEQDALRMVTDAFWDYFYSGDFDVNRPKNLTLKVVKE